MPEVDWDTHIRSLFFQKSGEHAIVGGNTGTGKTQTLFHMVANLAAYHKKETIIWFDVGKSSEILRLADFKPVNVFIPEGAKLDILYNEGMEKYDSRITKKYYVSFKTFLHDIERDKINVICIKPYEIGADDYATKISAFFKTLIQEATSYRLEKKVPLALIFDEMHWIAPGHGHALNEAHTDASKDVQMNIDTLRSFQIRFIGATQNWTKIRAGVRDACGWIFIKRGLTFTKQDEWKLSQFNAKWQALPTEYVVVAFPNRNFSDDLKLPFYGNGEKIGRVYYIQDSEPQPEEPQVQMEIEKGYA